MLIAISAYAVYVVNATQFLLKLRAARLEGAGQSKADHRQTGLAV
jgi:3-vinyl bacteriochlorophyllide hydratase